MGLPSYYQDKTYGECLSLIAALSHLKRRGIKFEQSGKTIIYTTEQRQVEVNPVAVPIGQMYRLEELNQ